MKLIGRYLHGEMLLACTRKEYDSLNFLARTVSGKALLDKNVDGEDDLDADMDAVLTAIANWVMIKDKANTLRAISEEIDAALGTKHWTS